MILKDCTNSAAQIHKQKIVDMSLDSQSVDSVKLCYDESINTYFIIEASQACAIDKLRDQL